MDTPTNPAIETSMVKLMVKLMAYGVELEIDEV